MTVTLQALWLYAGALVILWITPGPVFVALTARALSGGFQSAWPLAVGVTIGDVLWPLIAIFGLTWVLDQFESLMTILHWTAVAMFLFMGIMLIRHADNSLMTAEGRLTRPGMWHAFTAGVAAVIGNPKAIFFYMAVLPGFFDLRHVQGLDITAIVLLSMTIPLLGNLVTAYAVGQARRLLSSPAALRRLNIAAGSLLILVGGLITFL